MRESGAKDKHPGRLTRHEAVELGVELLRLADPSHHELATSESKGGGWEDIKWDLLSFAKERAFVKANRGE